MAKADMTIARLYAGLVADQGLRDRVFAMLHEEFVRARKQILALTGRVNCWRIMPCCSGRSACAILMWIR